MLALIVCGVFCGAAAAGVWLLAVEWQRATAQEPRPPRRHVASLARTVDRAGEYARGRVERCDAAPPPPRQRPDVYVPHWITPTPKGW